MSTRGRVAVVSPRADRRTSAESWAPLLQSQADVALCEAPTDAAVADADLIVVDDDVPQLDHWLTEAERDGRSPSSIVLVSGEARAGGRAIPWGREGEGVLTAISELLERRRLLEESSAFLEDLRASSDRLDRHRQRVARVVLDQAEALRGANESLTRDVERLTRLQWLPRFFADPGPDDTFDERLAEVSARTLGAVGAAVLRRRGDEWVATGRWKMSSRNALAIAPPPLESTGDLAARESTRKGHAGWWIPELGELADCGITALFREGRDPNAEFGEDMVLSVRQLLTEGLAARATSLAVAWRGNESERIVETLRGGLLKLDADGRVSVANPALAEALDRPLPDIEDAPLEDVFPADEHLVSLFREVLRSGRAVDDLETYATTARGRRVPISVRASATGDPEAPDGVLILVSDLSRRKEVEAEVRRVDRLSALGRLSAGVAHEIRNPLTGIRTTAELLRSRVPGEEHARFVDVILEETSRLDRIVSSLLQFAKPAPPRRKPLDVPGLLEHASRLAAGRAAERGVRLTHAPQSEDPGRPEADRDQILSVLLNLLLNAIEATPEGEAVELRTEPRTTDGRPEVHFIVEDGGEGVPPTLRERIFDPFFTTKPGGTGLGLSISQNILRQHGGVLRLERSPDGRSRAVAVLPLSADHQTGGDPWRTS